MIEVRLDEFETAPDCWGYMLTPGGDEAGAVRVYESFESEGRGEPDWESGESDRRPTVAEWMDRAEALGLGPCVGCDRTTVEFFGRGLHRTMKVARGRRESSGT